MLLRWVAVYADGREVHGMLPGELPGASVPRDGLRAFTLLQGTNDAGWAPIFTVELADHERLIFKRRMTTAAFSAAAPVAIGLIIGLYDPRTDSTTVNYFNGDGTITMRAATADVEAEPHEVG